MNEQNLIPTSQRSKSEARELGSKGGKASAKARREKAAISEVYARLLAKKTKVVIDGKPATGLELLEQVVTQILVKGSDSAKIALIKEIRETTEGSKVAITRDLPRIVIEVPEADDD